MNIIIKILNTFDLFHYLYFVIFVFVFKDIISKFENGKVLKENEWAETSFKIFNQINYGEFRLQKEDLNLIIDYLKKIILLIIQRI